MGENFWVALVRLTLKNKRRYGGYIVHLAVCLLFVGLAGNAFNAEAEETMREGDIFSLRSYTIRAGRIFPIETENYLGQSVELEVFQNGKRVVKLSPERRLYKTSGQESTEVRILSSLQEDLYLVFAGMRGEGAIIQAYVNPLVNWVWIGGILMVLGTLVAMLPDSWERRKESKPIPVRREGEKAFSRTTPVLAREGFRREPSRGEGTSLGTKTFLFWILFSLTGISSVVAATGTKTSLRNPAQVKLFKEVSRELTCQCGCGMNLATCNHPNCPWAIPARERIETMIVSGYRRDEIIQQFLALYGTGVRAAPPAMGFRLVYWIVPFGALAGGGLIAGVFARRWGRKAPQEVLKASEIDPELGRRIEKDLDAY